MGIAELCGANPLLLLFDPPPGFQGDTHRPFQIFYRNAVTMAGVEELEQPAHRFVDGVGIAARERRRSKPDFAGDECGSGCAGDSNTQRGNR